jgi:hypothetical protein
VLLSRGWSRIIFLAGSGAASKCKNLNFALYGMSKSKGVGDTSFACPEPEPYQYDAAPQHCKTRYVLTTPNRQK